LDSHALALWQLLLESDERNNCCAAEPASN
jgi:hypothetical protein